MKNKRLTAEEFGKTFKPETRLVFHEQSPFSEITPPAGTIFFASHWNDPGTSALMISNMLTTTGTTYAVCVRSSAGPIKIYAYKLSLNLDGSGGVVQEHDKEPLGYHWVEGVEKIPSFIKDQIPPSFLDTISKALKKDDSTIDSNVIPTPEPH